MGGVCAGCFKSSANEENAKFARQPQQQRPQPQPQQKKTSAEDRGGSEEARANAAIAALKRAETFEKSAGGKAAKKAIIAARAPPPSRDSRDDVLKDWTTGS